MSRFLPITALEKSIVAKLAADASIIWEVSNFVDEQATYPRIAIGIWSEDAGQDAKGLAAPHIDYEIYCYSESSSSQEINSILSAVLDSLAGEGASMPSTDGYLFAPGQYVSATVQPVENPQGAIVREGTLRIRFIVLGGP